MVPVCRRPTVPESKQPRTRKNTSQRMVIILHCGGSYSTALDSTSSNRRKRGVGEAQSVHARPTANGEASTVHVSLSNS